MSTAITLSLHGPLRIRGANGAELASLSLRGRALLAYLSQQPGMRAERGLLADLLWSDRAEEQARASLRQELALLRKALPEGVLDANRQTVWLDAARIALDQTGTGDFLQGFDLPSEGFEDWLRQSRALSPAAAPAPATPNEGTRPVLAILPFDELGAPEADMFADGVVEEITSALSRVHEFHVIARQSAFALRGAALDVPQAAARLGADYLVEGSVRRAGDKVRIAVQLARGSDGHTLWSARFDDRLDDLFALQDRIAAQVAGQISPSLRAAEIARARTRPPSDRTAYDLLLTAYPYFWSLRQDDNDHAAALLDDALRLDPDFVPAMALRAWVHAQQVTYMWSRDPAGERALALALAERAAGMVGDHAPSLTAIAGTYIQAGDDLPLAQTYLDRALALDPNNAWAWIRQGWLHQYVAEIEPALAAFDHAERLSPLDPFLHQITFGRAAVHYRFSEDPTEGLAMIEDGLRRHPGVLWPLRMVAAANIRLGNIERAQDAAQRLLAALPHLTISYLKVTLPPIAMHFNDGYFEDLARAGIPE